MRNFLSRGYAIILACIFLLAGCKAQEPVTPTEAQNTPVPSSTAHPSQTVTSTVQATQTPSPAWTSTATPTATALPTLIPTLKIDITAPAGIVHEKKGLWVSQEGGKRIKLGPSTWLGLPGTTISPDLRFLFFSAPTLGDTDVNTGAEDYPYQGEDLWLRDLFTGEIRSLTNNPATQNARQYEIWSPDSRYVFYCKETVEGGNKDIWVVDVLTGGKRNLTNTPNIDESRLRYWPGPNGLVFGSRADGEDGGPFNEGHLSAMRADGSAYQVLSSELVPDALDVSPDGQTLAIRGGYLIRWGEKARKMDFKLVDNRYQKADVFLQTPAWSPDGRRIAWSVHAGSLEGAGVYDLEKNELRLFHLSEPYGGEGFPSAPVWSPDGQWLAWEAWSQNPDQVGLWSIQPETGQEIYLGKFRNAKWRPDSRWIAFNGIYNGDINSYLNGVWVTEVGNWTPLRTDLPDFTELHAWYDPATANRWTGFPLLWYGDLIMVSEAGSPLALWAEPEEDTKVVVSIKDGQSMEVIGGPVIKNGFIWWKMRAEDGTEGWSVENEEWYEAPHG